VPARWRRKSSNRATPATARTRVTPTSAAPVGLIAKPRNTESAKVVSRDPSTSCASAISAGMLSPA
jgi:hypothetical protein